MTKYSDTDDMFFKAYLENFKNDTTDDAAVKFMTCFLKLRNVLSKLNSITGCVIDISKKKELIDFNIYLGNDIFLSVAKDINEKDEDVMYTIARKHKTLAIGIINVQELVDKVNAMKKEIFTVATIA